MDSTVIFRSLAAFFDDQFISIAAATFALFLIVLITWFVYKQLSKRNLFTLFQKSEQKESPSGGDVFLYILKYFFIFPLYSFLGFLIFAFSLFLITKPTTLEAETNTLFIAIVIVSTIRVSAYVSESMSEDLAKLVPLSVLVIILSNPSFEGLGITMEQTKNFLMHIPQFAKYLLFTIMLEIVLRSYIWLLSNIRKDTADDLE